MCVCVCVCVASTQRRTDDDIHRLIDSTPGDTRTDAIKMPARRLLPEAPVQTLNPAPGPHLVVSE